jgi:hypothetical protein
MRNVKEEISAIVDGKLNNTAVYKAEIHGDKLTISLRLNDYFSNRFFQEICAVVTVMRFKEVSAELFPSDYSKGIYLENADAYALSIRCLVGELLVFHDLYDEFSLMVSENTEE